MSKTSIFELPIGIEDGIFSLPGIKHILRKVRNTFPDSRFIPNKREGSVTIILSEEVTAKELLADALYPCCNCEYDYTDDKQGYRLCEGCVREREEWGFLLLGDGPFPWELDTEVEDIRLDTDSYDYEGLLKALDGLEMEAIRIETNKA